MSRRLLAIGLVLLALGVAGYYAWRWDHHRSKRRDALNLVQQHQYDVAEPVLKQIFERDPDDLEVIVALAKMSTQRSALVVNAEPYFRRWCELQPNNPEPFHGRLDMWIRLRDFERAIPDAEQLAQWQPDNTDIARVLARLYFETGKLEHAETTTAKLVASRPDDAEMANQLADIYWQRGDIAKAVQQLDTILERDPKNARALLLRGRIHAEAGPTEYDRAVRLLRQASVDGPRSLQQTARYHLSQVLRRTGQTVEADNVLQEMKHIADAERLLTDSRQQADNADLHIRTAKACFLAKMNKEGVALLEGVLLRLPTHAAARQALAAHYEEIGDQRNAAKYSSQ